MPLGATLAILAMFAGSAVVLSLRWRNDLHAGVVQREAEALSTAVLLLHETTPREGRFAEYGGDGATDLFTAVLKSTALQGSIMARCFDRDGNLREALPFDPDVRAPEPALRERALREGAVARFHPEARLEHFLGPKLAARAAAATAPLLEVVVPLRNGKSGPVLGVAHYWMDGAAVRAKLAAVDRGLLWQVGLIIVVGAGGIAAAAGWALRRLAVANRALTQQGEDLERANRELVLAAKTSAIGAISAHLIHGLKNPLDGLEGFVADASTPNGHAPDGEAWREAAETTRRLRTLVNDVVAVLRDEAAGAGNPVSLRDVVGEVLHKFACDAERNGVELTAVARAPDVTLDTRVAHLAGLVLTNLLGNALEAAPRGSAVKFAAGVARGEIEFQIEDHGPGLPPAVRKQLFRPMRSTKPGGSGIGLAISHQLARHVGGRLELVRSSDEGTVFRFVVPQN